MPRILIQPAAGVAAQAHFIETVETPVSLDRVREYVQAGELPEGIASLTEVPVWGVTPGKKGQNAKAWESVAPGDVVLFYGQKRFFASAVVLGKVHNAALAQALWGLDPLGATWEYVYFLDEITRRNIPVQAFNAAMGYQANNIPQGFQVVSGQRAEELLALFDLESEMTPPDVTVDEYEGVLAIPDGPLDVAVVGKRRVEQRFLRKQLFGKVRTADCCICGRRLPTELLVTAHIKRRADCTPEEMRDFQNLVASMCRLGCDAAFELHYIYVDDTGTVCRDERMPTTADLDGFVATVVGRQCPAWTPGSRGYFQWHAAQRRRLG